MTGLVCTMRTTTTIEQSELDGCPNETSRWNFLRLLCADMCERRVYHSVQFAARPARDNRYLLTAAFFQKE